MSFTLRLKEGRCWIADPDCCISLTTTTTPAPAVIVIDSDPFAYVISANIHRRHLTAEQKRELIARVIQADPSKSDRQIAETVKASPTTVGTVRAEMESTVQIGQLRKRVGKDGKSRAQPNRVRAPIHRAMKLGNIEGGAAFRREDVGPTSSGETARKDAEIEELRNAKRMLEIKIAGLESETKELKAQVRGLEDRGLQAIPLATLIDELEHRLPDHSPKKHLLALKALRSALGHRHLGATLEHEPVASRWRQRSTESFRAHRTEASATKRETREHPFARERTGATPKRMWKSWGSAGQNLEGSLVNEHSHISPPLGRQVACRHHPRTPAQVAHRCLSEARGNPDRAAAWPVATPAVATTERGRALGPKLWPDASSEGRSAC